LFAGLKHRISRYIGRHIGPYTIGVLVGLLAVALLSFSLRFWQISRFDDLVFDEVYFVNFARAYLVGAPEFDAHPPLGKYFIAAGIWLSDRATPFRYRWMNAAVGSCVPLLVFGLAYTLGCHQTRSRRLTFAILSGSFVAIDGLFVTESRYALINIYMVFFGVLGQYLWLLAAALISKEQRLQQSVLRLLAGVALGCAIATKWNGLGFILALIAYAIFQNKNNVLSLVVYAISLPLLVYSLAWLPHLWLTKENITALHTTLFTFHQQLSTDGHPACSKWYSWPILFKPITYWYQDLGAQVLTVSNLGNPFLWWLSSASVLLLSIAKRNAMSTYLLIGYAANWLPWIFVGRCTFIYLYMPAAVFSFMTLAWLMSQWLHSPAASTRWLGWAVLGAIAIAFFYWLALSIGSPLTPEQLKARWWLSTWV